MSKNLRISLNVLPPVDPTCPSAAIAYLKGFFQAENSAFQPRAIYWNQSIDNYIQAEFEGILNNKYRVLFYQTVFAHIFVCQKRGRLTDRSLEYLEAQGALSLIDYSVPLFRKISEGIASFLKIEVESLSLDMDDIVGCSISLNQLIPALVFLSLVKEWNPQAVTVLGGATKEEAELITKAFSFIDLCVFGEGEGTLLELCERVSKRKSLYTLKGTVIRKGVKTLVNEGRVPLQEIESIFADYEGFQWPASNGMNRLFIWDSRSCRWKRCLFCACERLFGNFRERSPESLIAEILYHLERFPELTANKLYIQFLGVDFRGSKTTRLVAILKKLRTLKIDYPSLRFFFWLSPGYINEQLMALLNAIGADIQFGFEQWSQMVRAMGKPHQIENGILTLKLVDRHPEVTIIGFNILLGFPGEKVSDLLQTQSTLYKLRFILAELLRKKQVVHGLQPTDIVIERTSSLGKSWNWNDPIVQESVKNDPVAQVLQIISGDELVARQLVINKGWVMCDVTGTQRLGRSLIESFQKELKRIRLDTYSSTDGRLILQARDTFGRIRDFRFPDEIYRRALEVTADIVTEEKLQGLLSAYRSEKLRQCLHELEEVGLLYWNEHTRRYVNTLPWSIQRKIGIVCSSSG